MVQGQAGPEVSWTPTRDGQCPAGLRATEEDRVLPQMQKGMSLGLAQTSLLQILQKTNPGNVLTKR